MNPVDLIQVFYKNDKGNLIAIRRQNKRAKWYKYSYDRVLLLGVLGMESGMAVKHTDIDKNHYVISLRKEH